MIGTGASRSAVPGRPPSGTDAQGAPLLRVLFGTTHSYLPQRTGGIECNTHEHCLELRARGHPVAVIARIEPRGWLGLENRIRRRLPFGPLFPADRRMSYPVYRGWNVEVGTAEVANRFGPDVAVAQGSAPVPLARSFLALDLPTILYLHDVEFHLLGGDVPGDPRFLVLANSRFTAERAREELDVEAQVVPPLVRPEAYRVESTGEKVVFVNPHPWKGVEIAFQLAERRPDIPFLFVESWRLRADRRAEYLPRAAALPNVEWRAPVSDMRTVYAQARLLLVPSAWEEAWGRVATEAQASGIPVLASRRGGLPESVGPGGILVNHDAPLEEWLAALSRLWDDPEGYARLREAAREHSRRPDIQPAAICERFVELASEHAAASGLRPLEAIPAEGKLNA